MNQLLYLAATDGEHPPVLLDPHGFGLVFWTAVIFGIVALLLYRLAWGPLLEALKAREEAITGSITSAEAIKKDAEGIREKWEEQMEGARQEAEAIINEGKADKAAVIRSANEQASREAAEIRARADRDIRLAKDKALSELKSDAASLGMMIAERVLAAEIDTQKHQGIIDEVNASYGKAE